MITAETNTLSLVPGEGGELTSSDLDAKAIGERITRARKEAGLHQRELADKIGVIPRSVQNYEAGRIPWKFLDAISAATGRTKEWLLYGDPADTELPKPGEFAEILRRLDVIEGLLRNLGSR